MGAERDVYAWGLSGGVKPRVEPCDELAHVNDDDIGVPGALNSPVLVQDTRVLEPVD